jgi:hypothetical protein
MLSDSCFDFLSALEQPNAEVIPLIEQLIGNANHYAKPPFNYSPEVIGVLKMVATLALTHQGTAFETSTLKALTNLAETILIVYDTPPDGK